MDHTGNDRQTLHLLPTAADLSNPGVATLTLRTTSLPDSALATVVIRAADQPPIAHVDTLTNEGVHLLISGSDFVDAAQVRYNGRTLPTTFVNAFVLEATICFAELRAGGMIDVVNPGAAASNEVVLRPSALVFLPVVLR